MDVTQEKRQEVEKFAGALVELMVGQGYTPAQVAGVPNLTGMPEDVSEILIAAMKKVVADHPEMAGAAVKGNAAFAEAFKAAVAAQMAPAIALGAGPTIGIGARSMTPSVLPVAGLIRAFILRDAAARKIRLTRDDLEGMVEQAHSELGDNANTEMVVAWVAPKMAALAEKIEEKEQYDSAKKAVIERVRARNWSSDSELEADDPSAGVIGRDTFNAIVRTANTTPGVVNDKMEVDSVSVDAILDVFGLMPRAAR